MVPFVYPGIKLDLTLKSDTKRESDKETGHIEDDRETADAGQKGPLRLRVEAAFH